MSHEYDDGTHAADHVVRGSELAHLLERGEVEARALVERTKQEGERLARELQGSPLHLTPVEQARDDLERATRAREIAEGCPLTPAEQLREQAERACNDSAIGESVLLEQAMRDLEVLERMRAEMLLGRLREALGVFDDFVDHYEANRAHPHQPADFLIKRARQARSRLAQEITIASRLKP